MGVSQSRRQKTLAAKTTKNKQNTHRIGCTQSSLNVIDKGLYVNPAGDRVGVRNTMPKEADRSLSRLQEYQIINK